MANISPKKIKSISKMARIKFLSSVKLLVIATCSNETTIIKLNCICRNNFKNLTIFHN